MLRGESEARMHPVARLCPYAPRGKMPHGHFFLLAPRFPFETVSLDDRYLLSFIFLRVYVSAGSWRNKKPLP